MEKNSIDKKAIKKRGFFMRLMNWIAEGLR